jgi:hypothetical protein
MALSNKKTMYHIFVIVASFIVFLLTYPKPYAEFFMFVAVIGAAFTIPHFISLENKKVKYLAVGACFLLGFLIILLTSLNI